MATVAEIKDPRISQAALAIPGSAIESVPYLDFRQVTAITRFTPDVFYGTIVGTGAALVVDLPFDPAEVRLINETKLASFEKTATMPVGDTFKRVTAGTMTKLATTAGITLGAKDERKFTIGDDSQLNSASDVLHFVATGTRGIGGSA